MTTAADLWAAAGVTVVLLIIVGAAIWALTGHQPEPVDEPQDDLWAHEQCSYRFPTKCDQPATRRLKGWPVCEEHYAQKIEGKNNLEN